MTTFRSLRVSARLEAGIAWAGPWGIALDGLLAARVHAEAKSAPGAPPHVPVAELANPDDLPLPLARCGPPDSWHWAATCAWPVDGHDLMPDVRWWSARPDHAHLEALTAHLPINVREREGRYRARWMPLLNTACTSVTWHAVGDPGRIQQLLSPIVAIGKKRAAGHGHVLSWTIDQVDELDPWDTAHLHPDGTLGRPTPAGCLTGHPNIVDGGTGTAGLRPPYIHPARQARLHLPAQDHP